MARFNGTTGNETFAFTFERDSVVIEPGGGRDTVTDFDSSLDIVAVNDFTTLDGFEDLEPFLTREAATATLDLSAASGGTPGDQTLTFTGIQGVITKENFFFNIEPDPVFFDSDYVPVPPGGVIPINVPADDGGLLPPRTERLPDEPPPPPPEPYPPDCNLCHDQVLIPAWD
jgi:hypothetical protein